MFRLLLWKEWKENLWKFLFCGVASAAFTVLLFRIRIFADIENCIIISTVQAFILPTIFGMDVFSGEMAGRTIYLLFKIPVRRWKIFVSKYVISIAGIVFAFVFTGVLMELIAQGREMAVFELFERSSAICITAVVLFTWFCLFGCQGRSEAGSLAVMASVFVGWGIVFFWAGICKVEWAMPFVPYVFMPQVKESGFLMPLLLQSLVAVVVLILAGIRYVKIKRYI